MKENFENVKATFAKYVPNTRAMEVIEDILVNECNEETVDLFVSESGKFLTDSFTFLKGMDEVPEKYREMLFNSFYGEEKWMVKYKWFAKTLNNDITRANHLSSHVLCLLRGFINEMKRKYGIKNVKTPVSNWKDFEDVDDGELVDLGLPSGTKWAKRNIAARRPSDQGAYFAWGEIDGHFTVTDEKMYGWDDYKYADSSESDLNKYDSNDDKTVLDKDDDAAYVSSGGALRMPTSDEFDELLNHTDNKWITVNGMNGVIFMNKSDHSKAIFIPASGYYYEGVNDVLGVECCLWSSTLNKDEEFAAKYCCMSEDGFLNVFDDLRCAGMSVRGVENK